MPGSEISNLPKYITPKDEPQLATIKANAVAIDAIDDHKVDGYVFGNQRVKVMPGTHTLKVRYQADAVGYTSIAAFVTLDLNCEPGGSYELNAVSSKGKSSNERMLVIFDIKNDRFVIPNPKPKANASKSP